jgi:oligoribonuclease
MIAWIDLETTGLDWWTCNIIEVAVVVTDDNFNQLGGAYNELVEPNPFWNWEEKAHEMHEKSGLLAKAEKYGTKTLPRIDREIAAFLPGDDLLILGGQSVHFDKAFMEQGMPKTYKRLHHRHLDVSTLKLFFSGATSIPMDALPPDKTKVAHRALDDIQTSIDAARWYRDNLVKTEGDDQDDAS